MADAEPRITWARPGPRRPLSVRNALRYVRAATGLALPHRVLGVLHRDWRRRRWRRWVLVLLVVRHPHLVRVLGLALALVVCHVPTSRSARHATRCQPLWGRWCCRHWFWRRRRRRRLRRRMRWLRHHAWGWARCGGHCSSRCTGRRAVAHVTIDSRRSLDRWLFTSSGDGTLLGSSGLGSSGACLSCLATGVALLPP